MLADIGTIRDVPFSECQSVTSDHVETGGVTMTWSDDVAEADWIANVLHPFARNVGSVMPDGYAGYARLFHPVRRAGNNRVRWAQIAGQNERLVHREMQFHLIDTPAGTTPPTDRIYSGDLSWGSLPRAELTHLVEVLVHATDTPLGCWFAVWDGYGQLHGNPAVARLSRGRVETHAGIVPAEVLAGPRVRLPGRDYLLLRGPVRSVVSLHDELGDQSPNLWWPADRAWCVATEIDFSWTYIGGSDDLINRVVLDPAFEALPSSIQDRFTIDSDLLNEALNH